MTDAESFYLILAIFYLIECVKFRPPNTRAIENAWGAKKGWRPKSEFSRLLGIKKWLFLYPFLPWPGKVLILHSSPDQPIQKTPYSTSRTRKLLFLLEKSTLTLRHFSLLIFAYFFIGIPLLYRLQRGEPEFLFSIAIGYLLMGASAFLYFRIHKRWLLQDRGNRIINTFYTALLPWHSMRCVDDILSGVTKSWDHPTLLASLKDSPRCLAFLMKLWREAHYIANPHHSLEHLKSVTYHAGIDTDDWLVPHTLSGSKYCPCCFAPYESTAKTCNDCPEVALVENRGDPIRNRT